MRVKRLKGKIRRITMTAKSMQTKPSIVFCHGIWADGSCFNKVIPTLQTDGHQVIAAQYGLDSLASDVATVKRTLGRARDHATAVRVPNKNGRAAGGQRHLTVALYRGRSKERES